MHRWATQHAETQHAEQYQDAAYHGFTPPAVDAATLGRQGAGETVLFVDPRVTDWQELVAGVKPGVDVVVLDPNQDGIAQVTQALAGLTDVKAIEFLTDGAPGAITLGSSTLNAATLSAYATEVMGWSSHLGANAAVVFWGCDVGQGATGEAFVADVHTLTGATVAASSEPVGAAALGGDWALQVTTGPLPRNIDPFTAASRAAYPGVLDSPAATLAIINESNDTAGLGQQFDPTGTASASPLAVTDGEVVGMRATLQLPEGSDGNVSMTLTLPNNLALDPNYATDGSVRVLLVSPNGDFTTTLSGTGLQYAEGSTAINTAKFDLGIGNDTTDFVLAALPASAISAAGQTVTFNLGALSNTDGSAVPNYVIVEFNAVVGAAVAGGTSLNTTMVGSVNGTPTSTVTDYASVAAPAVALAKQVAGITYNADGSAAVTYVDTITNNGNGPAYSLTLTDPGAGVGTAAYAGITSGTGAVGSAGALGSGFAATLGILPASGAQSFTYTVTIPASQVNQAVSDAASTASVVSSPLNPAYSTYASGEAQTVSYTSTYPGTPTSTSQALTDWSDGSQTLTLSEFNPSLGALQSVTLTLYGDADTSGTVANLNGGTVTVIEYTASLQIDILQPGFTGPFTLTGVGGQGVGGHVLVGASPVLVNLPFHDRLTAGESSSFSQTDTNATATAAVIADWAGDFVGTGNIVLPLFATTTTNAELSGGNLMLTESASAYAEGTVTYTYVTPAVARTSLMGTALTPLTETASATVGLDLISGTVSQDTAPTRGADTSLVALAGQTVTVTFPGQAGVESVRTAADGSFSVLVPDDVSGVTVTAGASGTGVPAGDVLDNHPDAAVSLAGTTPTTTGSNPATLSFTPAADSSYVGIPFDFWHALDTAPVLSNGPSGPVTYTSGTAPVVLFGSATAADAQLDASFGGDFSGTTLTVQRYVSGVAAPNAGDVFAGTGTAASGVYLDGSDGHVLYNGGEVGTYTEVAGKLAISFAASGVSESTVDAVLQGLAWSYTGSASLPIVGAVIGVQIDDANNDPIGLNGFAPDPSGPHDQGPGGDLLSNVLTATVNIEPAVVVVVPTLSVVGGSNDSAGLGTLFDPNGMTPATSVLMTDGEIVRMRATLQLSGGNDTNVSMTVTLPSGLTFANDGSTSVLLVSPGGDFTTTLSGTNLQLADASVNAAKLDLGTGSGTDVVQAALPGGALAAQTVTFNLGTLSNFDGSAAANYVVVEFNAVVGNAVAGGTSLASTMVGSVNGTPTATVDDYVHVEAPTVTLGKQVEGIVYNADGSATVTYVDTISNVGDGPAYGLTLSDPGASVGTAAYAGASGGGVGIAAGVVGGGLQATLTSLPSGGTESFGYTVTIPESQVDQAVSDAAGTASVVSAALNPAHEVAGKEVLSGTALTPLTATASAAVGLDLVSGTVNQDTAPTEGADTSLVALAGQTVTVTFPGQAGVESVRTAADGSFSVLVPDDVSGVTVTAGASGPGAPVGDVLDNHPDAAASLMGTAASTTGSNPATLSFTPAANSSYVGIPFDFWHASPAQPSTPAQPGMPILATPTPTPFTPSSLLYQDDLTSSLIDNPNLGLSDDLLGRPLIPELWLVGSEADHYIIVEQQAIIGLPPDMFVDSMPNAHLSLEAKRPDGSPLPSWLSFDPTDMTFYGIPPLSAVGRVEIIITATDMAGNTANAAFGILVGHEERDLIGLISGRRPGGFQLTPSDIRHINLGDAQPAERSLLADGAAVHQEIMASMASAHAPPSGPAGFSAALREAGPMATLARARALLDALEGLADSRSPA